MHWIATAALLTVHLLFVNFAMIGPFLAVWYDWRGQRLSRPELAELGRQLAGLSIAALLVGGLLGGLLLLARFAGDPRYFRAIAAVPRDRLWFAGAELAFSLLCLLVTVAFWRRWQRARIVHRLVGLAGASNLLVHFPTLFVAISVIATRPTLMQEPLERSAYRRLLIDPEVVSRVAHVWLAGVAIAGLVVVWLVLGKRMFAQGSDPATDEPCQRLVREGGRISMTAVMLQFPVGLWVAYVMPESARRYLLGEDAAATLLFLASVGLAMVLLNLLSALILGERKRAMARRSSAVLIVLMFLMIGTRLRSGELSIPRAVEGRRSAVSAGAPLASRESYGSMGEPASYPPRPIPRFVP